MSDFRASNSAFYISAALAIFPMATPATAASEVTARAVMEKMDAGQRAPFIAGVVEGVAFARYMRDGKKVESLNCVYDWFMDKPETLNVIYAAFGRYPDFTPGAIVWELAKKSCGD
jgi:hypothetical protein